MSKLFHIEMGCHSSNFAHIACDHTRFTYDSVEIYKSKFFIYYNVELMTDIKFTKYKIPSSITYKVVIINASSDDTLFLDDDLDPIYLIIKKYAGDESKDTIFTIVFQNISKYIPSDLEIVLNHFKYQPGSSGYERARDNYEKSLK
jgi:hypothetical protein